MAKDGVKTTTTRAGSKQSQLIAMLRRPDGASIEEIAERMGWQHHTVRGAIAGALKKKLGLDVQSQKVEGRGTVYKLSA
jgi:predicted ArsR family transcriptional regulator